MCLCVSSNYKCDYQGNCNCCLPGNMDRTFQKCLFRLRWHGNLISGILASTHWVLDFFGLFPTEVWFQLYLCSIGQSAHSSLWHRHGFLMILHIAILLSCSWFYFWSASLWNTQVQMGFTHKQIVVYSFQGWKLVWNYKMSWMNQGK